MEKSKDELKVLFENGDKPTQDDFWALIDSYLDKPTATDTTANYKYVVGINDNGDSAKLAAGDLGKNIGNTDLTIPSGTTRTLTTTGAALKFTGLQSAQGDASFNKRLKKKADGTLGEVDENALIVEDILKAPSLLTASQKSQLATNWGGQYSNSSPAIYSVISPPINNTTDEVAYIIVNGLNLNLNPDVTSIYFVKKEALTFLGDSLIPNGIECLGYSTFSNGDKLLVTKEKNLLSLGEYQIVIKTVVSGMPVIIRSAQNILVGNYQSIDLTNLGFDKVIYTDKLAKNYSAGGNAVSMSADLSNADGTDFLETSLGSSTSLLAAVSKAIPTLTMNDDFYIMFKWNSSGSVGGSVTPAGLVTEDSASLVNNIIAGCNLFNTSVSNIGGNTIGLSAGATIVLIKKGNSITTLIITSTLTGEFSSTVALNNSPVKIKFLRTVTNGTNVLTTGIIQEAYKLN